MVQCHEVVALLLSNWTIHSLLFKTYTHASNYLNLAKFLKKINIDTMSKKAIAATVLTGVLYGWYRMIQPAFLIILLSRIRIITLLIQCGNYREWGSAKKPVCEPTFNQKYLIWKALCLCQTNSWTQQKSMLVFSCCAHLNCCKKCKY